MIPEHLTKSTRSAKNAMFAALVLIGAVAVYNRIVTPHRNYLMAAQQYESAVDHLDKKNQTIHHDLQLRKKNLKNFWGSSDRLISNYSIPSKQDDSSAIFRTNQKKQAALSLY